MTAALDAPGHADTRYGIPTPASFWSRVWARLIDTAVLLALIGLGWIAVVNPMRTITADNISVFRVAGPVLYGIGFVLAIGWLWWWVANEGKTPGKAAMGITLVDNHNCALGYRRVALRAIVVAIIEGCIPVVGSIINGIWLYRRQAQGSIAMHDSPFGARAVVLSRGRHSDFEATGEFEQPETDAGPGSFAPHATAAVPAIRPYRSSSMNQVIKPAWPMQVADEGDDDAAIVPIDAIAQRRGLPRPGQTKPGTTLGDPLHDHNDGNAELTLSGTAASKASQGDVVRTRGVAHNGQGEDPWSLPPVDGVTFKPAQPLDAGGVLPAAQLTIAAQPGVGSGAGVDEPLVQPVSDEPLPSTAAAADPAPVTPPQVAIAAASADASSPEAILAHLGPVDHLPSIVIDITDRAMAARALASAATDAADPIAHRPNQGGPAGDDPGAANPSDGSAGSRTDDVASDGAAADISAADIGAAEMSGLTPELATDFATSPSRKPIPAEPAPAAAQSAPETVGPQPGPGAPSADTGWAVCLPTGQRVWIDGPIVLGRQPLATNERTAPVVVPDDTLSVSKTHAYIDVDDHGPWVSDQSSSNGTYVITSDGTTHRVLGGPRRLVEGDIIRLGQVDCVIEVHPLVADGNSTHSL